MLKIYLILMMIISNFMSYTSNPMALGLIILSQAIFTSLSMYSMTFSSWIPMSTFLVMVGGLMIMFLYTSSISSNEQFKFVNKKIWVLTILISLFYLLMSWNPEKCTMMLNFLNTENKEYLKMFSIMNMKSSMFIFLYLLMALIILLNLISFMKSPMRKKY